MVLMMPVPTAASWVLTFTGVAGCVTVSSGSVRCVVRVSVAWETVLVMSEKVRAREVCGVRKLTRRNPVKTLVV